MFVARGETALDALPAVYDIVGKEERDANARYRLLLDIQDAFSLHSDLITSYKVGSKDLHSCFSGASFIKWLRDEGSKHLNAQSVDLSHEGVNALFPPSLACHSVLRFPQLYTLFSTESGGSQEYCASSLSKCSTSASCDL